MSQAAHPSRDPYNLDRFLAAQQGTFEQARSELAAGQKRTHWMWFIFPQIRGLGSSPAAQRFAISSLEEASAYLRHPVLGPRLRECTALVNAVGNRPVDHIFGYPDDLKFHSSMTLFAQAAAVAPSPDSQDHVFSDALAKHFSGSPDAATVELLQSTQTPAA